MRRATSLACAAVVLTAACSPSAPTPTASPTPTTVHRSTAMLCRIDHADRSGRLASYYLEVHSAAFDFTECASGVVIMTAGPPLVVEGMQRQCMYSPTTDPRVHAVVYVSSTADPANVSASAALCATHHGV